MRATNKRLDFLKELEAPPRFELGMEVLQTSKTVASVGDSEGLLNVSYR